MTVNLTVRASNGATSGLTLPDPVVTTGGAFDIPLRWDDPMFTGMTVGGGAQMSTNQTITRRSTTGGDSGLFIFNQIGAATLSYCRMTSTVSNDCDVLTQVSDNTVNVDHCYINNNLPTNPSGTHADGLQLQLATWDQNLGKRNTPAGGVINLKNSMIVIGGNSVTAGMFCSDQWHGRINLTNVVFQTWTQYGLIVHADQNGDVDLYCNNVFFDTRNGNSGRLLNVGSSRVNIRQWNNVRRCTVNNGVLTLGSLIPQPTPSTSGANF